MILPADMSWSDGAQLTEVPHTEPADTLYQETTDEAEAAAALRTAGRTRCC